MRKKLNKRIGCLLAALCLFALECGVVSAAEMPVVITQQTDLSTLNQYDTDGDGIVQAIVVGSEVKEDTSYVGIMPMSSVLDNGVRLRSAPNTSSTVLELMYVGEVVYIDLTVSANYKDWYFLKRAKTGTWGYASSLYIYSS